MTDRWRLWRGRSAILTVAPIVCGGCHAAFQSHGQCTLRTWPISDERSVELTWEFSGCALDDCPEHNYSRAGICAVEGDLHRVIAPDEAMDRVRDSHGTSMPGREAPVPAEVLEARTDGARDRVWQILRKPFVEQDRVFASYDFAADAAIGPDDPPPPWARFDEGIRLEPIGQVTGVTITPTEQREN